VERHGRPTLTFLSKDPKKSTFPLCGYKVGQKPRAHIPLDASTSQEIQQPDMVLRLLNDGLSPPCKRATISGRKRFCFMSILKEFTKQILGYKVVSLTYPLRRNMHARNRCIRCKRCSEHKNREIPWQLPGHLIMTRVDVVKNRWL
jgi:hypothetical protein